MKKFYSFEILRPSSAGLYASTSREETAKALADELSFPFTGLSIGVVEANSVGEALTKTRQGEYYEMEWAECDDTPENDT